MKYFPAEIEKTQGFIKGFQSDIRTVAAHPLPEEEFCGMEVNGTQFTEKAEAGEDTRLEASLVKMQGTEIAGRVLDRGIQVFGAAGVSLDNPIAHWWRSQRPARIYEGPTEVHKYHVLARRLFR